MDFGEVLQTAKQNGSSKPQIQYYSTKFAPPKKEQRNKTVSVNVQKFLARKEAEEKKKMEEARIRREKLLELRSHDKKATRRVSVMLKRTKSANKAVIDDAKDVDNTAVTLVGPSQPDEDDYGYVSKESEALYNKMMEKYSKMPEEAKFGTEKRKVSTNLTNTKEKVMAALERERLEASLPHRRKRKHESSTENEKKDEVSPKYEEEKKKEKTKFKPAPLVNFDELLKLAAQKQHEPIKIEPKKVEEERLLTKKQKKEMEKEKEWRDRKESRGKPQPENRNSILKPPQKVNGAPINDVKNIKKPDFKVPNTLHKPTLPSNPPKIQSERNSVPKDINNKRVEKIPQKINDKERIDREKVLMKNPNLPSFNKNVDQRNGERKPIQGMLNGKRKEINSKEVQKRPLDVRPQKIQDLKPKEFPPKDLKPKQFPPADIKPKQFPPPDVKKKQFPSKDVKRKPLVANKGRILDDDEDYDSEMDDFIDDGPEEEEDYSSIIGQIFGYDKRRYKQVDEDDDTDNMESTFAQQMREECISTKIGIKEDLEDMQREEEEKKLKAQRMKKLKRQ